MVIANCLLYLLYWIHPLICKDLMFKIPWLTATSCTQTPNTRRFYTFSVSWCSVCHFAWNPCIPASRKNPSPNHERVWSVARRCGIPCVIGMALLEEVSLGVEFRISKAKARTSIFLFLLPTDPDAEL